MSEPPFKIYNVEKAMIRFAEPDDAARLQELAPHARSHTSITEHLHREYRALEAKCLTSLKEKLRRGELKARCFDANAALTDAKVEIAAEQWEQLDLDPDSDSLWYNDLEYPKLDIWSPSENAGVRPSSIGKLPVILRFCVDTKSKQVRFDFGGSVKGRQYDLFSILTKQHQQDIVKNCAPEKFAFISAGTLAEQLEIDEESVRKYVSKIREDIAQAFSRAEATLDEDAIIQNSRGVGYRLNPHLVEVPSALLVS